MNKKQPVSVRGRESDTVSTTIDRTTRPSVRLIDWHGADFIGGPIQRRSTRAGVELQEVVAARPVGVESLVQEVLADRHRGGKGSE